MIDDEQLLERARTCGVLPVGDGLFEAVLPYLPEMGKPMQMGERDTPLVLVPIEQRGMIRITDEVVERYSDETLRFGLGRQEPVILFRQARPEEVQVVLDQEAEETAQREHYWQVRDTWNAVKARFVADGKPFKEKLFPNGDPVVTVVDTLHGDYCVILDEPKWMWWVHVEPVTEEQYSDGYRGPATAYRLRWDEQIAHTIRNTPAMPDNVNRFPRPEFAQIIESLRASN